MRHCKDRFLYRRAARSSPSSTRGPHPPLPTPPARRGAAPCAPRSCHAHPSLCIRRIRHFTVPRTARHRASRGPADTACGGPHEGSAAGGGLRADLRADKPERMRPLRPRPFRKGEANASGERGRFQAACVPLRRTWLRDVARGGPGLGFQSARQRRTRDKPQKQAIAQAKESCPYGSTHTAKRLGPQLLHANSRVSPPRSEAIAATCRTRRRRRA